MQGGVGRVTFRTSLRPSGYAGIKPEILSGKRNSFLIDHPENSFWFRGPGKFLRLRDNHFRCSNVFHRC